LAQPILLLPGLPLSTSWLRMAQSVAGSALIGLFADAARGPRRTRQMHRARSGMPHSRELLFDAGQTPTLPHRLRCLQMMVSCPKMSSAAANEVDNPPYRDAGVV
jgi:hypothetical protein